MKTYAIPRRCQSRLERVPHLIKLDSALHATIPLRSISAGTIRHPRTAQGRIARRRGLLARFQRFIESTGWEESVFCARWIDAACAAVIVASLCFFTPLMAALLVRLNP